MPKNPLKFKKLTKSGYGKLGGKGRPLTPKQLQYSRSVGGEAYKVGEWDRAVRLARRMTRVMPESYLEVKDWADDTRDWLVEKLERQEFKHAPLSETYLERKRAEGQDERILIARGEYLDAIKTLSMGPRMYGVGINAGAKDSEGKSLITIGLSNEYGDPEGGLPARPHWRPAYAHAALDGIDRFREILKDAIKAKRQPWVRRKR